MFQPFIPIMQPATLAALGESTSYARERTAPLHVTALAYVPTAASGAYLDLRLFDRLRDRQFARILPRIVITSGIGLMGSR